eukprot:CAMPEP_0180705296 /NCGR_PEP_ID=MMETSP1038_2-20121128/7604_1 /TAXON_ID=632150 /ORGANISM="Azadinium spinosum, Strain 3D9" /LENGTH=165 /DNA_ID=CAMNT_0022737167 /DNA_START=1 /DNA_END=495 /DNA_ORIENTATION=-
MLALRRVELERQQAESRRLRSEGQRLRAELRRARPAAAIAQALHQGSCGSRPAAPLGPSEEERAGLVARQAEAQASAESLVSEAAELEERLRQRQALEAEAAVLIEALSRSTASAAAQLLKAPWLGAGQRTTAVAAEPVSAANCQGGSTHPGVCRVEVLDYSVGG